MWNLLAEKADAEEALFRFLLTVRDGNPRAYRGLIINQKTLHALYAKPHPDLVEALRHCLDTFLIELEPGRWDPVNVSPFALGLALAANNCLAPAPMLAGGPASRPEPQNNPVSTTQFRPVGRPKADTDRESASESALPEPEFNRDPVTGFTAALIATLPLASTCNEALVYHAILRSTTPALAQPGLNPQRATLLHALFERSPLTTLWSLDVHDPTPLDELAEGLLFGWQPDHYRDDNGPNAAEWLAMVTELLARPRLAHWLRHRWLNMPETHRACRNLGLVLETLRRLGDQRAVILDFYEAYDYFRAEIRPNGDRAWPLLALIEKLLRTAGDDDLAIRANRRGNAYFLKFRPLLEIVAAENMVPPDYAFLTPGFVLALQRLVPYITEDVASRIVFEETVTFEEQGKV